MARQSRILAVEQFANNKLISIPVPKDTSIIGLVFRLYGSVKTTYASGTPVAKPEGAMDALLQRIDVVQDGQDTLKSVRPHFLAMQQLFATGVANERFASAGASALANAYPTTEQGFVYGTTGQVTTVRESVYLPFEMIYCEPGFGRELTWWNTKRAQSAEIKIQCDNIANLLLSGNTAPVVYSDIDLKIEVSTIEDQSVPEGAAFHYWKQAMINRAFKGQGTDIQVEIPKGNHLAGFMMYSTNGDAAKAATNDLLQTVGIRKNGLTTFQKVSFKTQQAMNRAEYGSTAAFAAGTSRLDGIAHFNLLLQKQLLTAQTTKKEEGIDSLDLMLDVSSLGTFSPNEANVNIVWDEIIFAKTAKK